MLAYCMYGACGMQPGSPHMPNAEVSECSPGLCIKSDVLCLIRDVVCAVSPRRYLIFLSTGGGSRGLMPTGNWEKLCLNLNQPPPK